MVYSLKISIYVLRVRANPQEKLGNGTHERAKLLSCLWGFDPQGWRSLADSKTCIG